MTTANERSSKANPASQDNEVAKIDRELDRLGDLEDLRLQYDHARELERSAEQAWRDFVAHHFREIVEAHQGEAEAVAAEANEAARVFAEKLGNHRAFHGRIVGFTAAVPWIDGRAVPGSQAVADLSRVAESVDLEPPLPILPAEES
jgi:hypothetical protein